MPIDLHRRNIQKPQKCLYEHRTDIVHNNNLNAPVVHPNTADHTFDFKKIASLIRREQTSLGIKCIKRAPISQISRVNL